MNVAGTVALLWLLRRRIGRIDLERTLSAVGRIVAASIPLAVVSFGVWYGLDAEYGNSFPGKLGALAPALLLGGATYLGACRLFGVRELDTLLNLRSRRPGPKPDGGVG